MNANSSKSKLPLLAEEDLAPQVDPDGDTFDLAVYFKIVDSLFKNCGEIVDRRVNMRVEPSLPNWQVAECKATLEFFDGSKLSCKEYYRKEADGTIMRTLWYHYMNAQDYQLFRLTSHDRSIPLAAPLTLRREPTMRPLEDGDPELGDICLKRACCLDVIRWIKQHLAGGGFPWR